MLRAHTYSVVARDPASGDFGVAVQSHWFNVGRIVPWARAGIGAVATQSMVEVSYGPKGLALMEAGSSARQALSTLLAADEGRALRQVAMVDATGEVAVHTGESCIAEAGHLSGDGWSVQANIMRSDVVIPAMADAMGASTGDFADRLLAALVAAEATGGDLRGSQSASLLVVAEGTDEPRLDLRVDDHPDPVAELSRLLHVARAYDLMNEGDEALAAGDLAGAGRAYSAAARSSKNPEILFWQGLGLVESGESAAGMRSLRSAVEGNPDLGELLRRLPAAGLIDPTKAAELQAALGLS